MGRGLLGSAEDVGEVAGGLTEGVRRAKGAEQGGWGEGDGALVGNVGSEKGANTPAREVVAVLVAMNLRNFIVGNGE